MALEKKELQSQGIRFSITQDDKEVGRGFLYIIKNDLHDQPYGLMEDIFVDEDQRSKGYGTQIVEAIIKEAKAQNCYKLIGQSRYGRDKVHELYEKLGFVDHGKNFRMDL